MSKSVLETLHGILISKDNQLVFSIYVAFAHFLDCQDKTKFRKRIMHDCLAWNRKFKLLWAKQPGYMVSIFCNTSSVCNGLFAQQSLNMAPRHIYF